MQEIVEALYARARRAKTPMYKVCKEAGVSPGTPSGWRRGVNFNSGTVKKLSEVLDRIEAERHS